jgi:hypothetical protein
MHGKSFQERFRSKSGNVPPKSTPEPKCKKWRRHYVRVPWVWVEQLRLVKRTSTWHLAHVLLYEHWRTGGKPIALSNVATREEGLSRYSKWRALKELASLGLITIEMKAGRSPRIVVRV